MTIGHDPEATVSSLRGRGVKAVRLLYTDLHGVARGKDIPIGHFLEMLEEGVAFCSVIMGTDLRHTPVAGGGVVHGPTPRGYEQRTPKKMKAAALRGALSDRAARGASRRR